MYLTLSLALLLPSLTLSAPLPITAAPAPLPLATRDAPQASSLIVQIMPGSASCAGATDPDADDCRTAEQAAPFLITALQNYGLYAPGQIAAVLSLIGYESVDMRYKHNISPGRPGQGTSAMLMPDNVAKYVASIPALKDGLAAAGTDVTKILDLVTVDEYNFGAAPWWLTQVCSKDVVDGLVAGTDAAFEAYMGCVGVTATDDRLAYWHRAQKAFGLA